MKTKRIISLLLSLIMILSIIPATVLADNTTTAAADATVYLTVSNQGVLAADNDGKVMANREVTVKDIDKDGKLTYDEALTAAHELYNRASGYALSYGYVNSLWSNTDSTYLFFINNEGIESGVETDTVKDGDKLTASINKDSKYYADWYTFFDSDTKAVTVGEAFTLTLKGHLGMAYTDEDKADIALSNVKVGTWNDGDFSQINDKTTDENGKVTLSFDTAGTYYVTASGTVKDSVTTNWSTGATEEKDCPIIVPACVVTVTEAPPSTPSMSDEDAVKKIYDEFSKHGDYKSGLEMPLTYKGTEYGNIYSYIRAWAKEETGRDVSVDATVSPSTTTYIDWSSGTAQSKSYTPLASDGTVTQEYFKNNGPVQLSYLKNITLTVGTKTETISKLYISIPSLIRSDTEIVEYTKNNLPFARIANGNADENHIVQALGEKSGSVISLPNSTSANDLYNTQTVTTKWTLTSISGKEDALKLASNKITVSRPNVGEENAVFDLTAKITSKNDDTVSDTITYRLTVPAFDAALVPIQVTDGATLSLIDSYYGASFAVDGKYIKKQENAPEGYDLYNCTLHTDAAGKAQNFNYTVTKDGYITKSGKISVTGTASDATVIDLVASSEDDTRLASLKSTAPEFTIDLADDKTEYYVDVEGVQYISLAGTTKISEATAKITSYYKTLSNANKPTLTTKGTALTTSGVKCYLPDKAGKSKIEITVTAPTGSTQSNTTRVYTITVNKKTDSGPLTNLTLKASSTGEGTKNSVDSGDQIPAEETLSPSFLAGGNETSGYSYTVNYWRDQISVKPTAKDYNITVNGTTVESGKETAAIPLKVGNNEIKIAVTKNGTTTDYIVNVRRKAEFYITDVTLDEGKAAQLPPTDGSDWTGNCSFNYNADKIHVTYHTNLSAEEEKNVTVEVVDGDKTYSGKAGQPIEISVGTSKKINPSTFLYYTAQDGVVEGQKYVISYSRKGADAPSSVESYLPAPGQFVNDSSYREANKTLTGGSKITLGSFGGNVVYKYDEPIQNDPANPYGIDFIVFGNCFLNSDGSTASGAAEPAAVMVSKDGEAWYELAGSEYYTSSARHNVKITWTNGDATFSAAADTAWETNDGESGTMPTNKYHSQPYYPNPDFYNSFQNGIGKNESYNKNTVSFTGTMIDKGFYPFGYADSHGAKNDKATNTAVNPYTGNDAYVYNGDGFDLDWAVDKDGNPVSLDEISYIKIYNAALSYGTSTGEVSAEINLVLRAASGQAAVGKSKGLSALSINGKTIELTEGTNTYTFDAEDASTLGIKPTAENANANIYVSNQYVKSGEETVLTATDKIRIIVQEDECEPIIYMLNISNIRDAKSNASLTSLTLTPGDITKTPNTDNKLDFTVENSISAIRFTPQTANKKATLSLSGGTLEQAITPLNAQQSDAIKLNVGENIFTLKVTSENGNKEQTYTVTVTRKSGDSSGRPSDSNTIQVKFSLTGDTLHYDKNTNQNTGTHSNPIWISSQTVTLPKNSTVKYLTEMMLNNAGLDYKTDGIYISEINGLAEFDNGNGSGWMYRHNGLIANEGYAVRTLSDGDVIKWFYTDDYLKETSYEGNWDKVNSSSGTSKIYTVKFETDGGSEIKNQNITKNGTVTKPSEPTKNGYIFDGWYTDKSLTVSYDFASRVTNEFTLYAKWTKIEGNTADTASMYFTDVAAGSWYEKAVEYAVKNGLFEGISETEFAPETDMTRAMLVTVLYRLEKAEIGEKSARFTDLTEDWYKDAVIWAAGNGIVSGITDTLFAPNDKITREQTATILYRYAKYKGYDTTQGGMAVREFDDFESISEYALDAVTWAVNTSLISGMGDNTIAPLKSATRAEIATILMRFCETIAK